MNTFDKTEIPSYVSQIGENLISSGFEAYLVGGCVRDTLLGKAPKDWDIATNAHPENIAKLFDRSLLVGARFGTVIVLIDDEKGETQQVEVTTYRSEADYIDGRWPSKVEYSQTINEDLSRRDFTINAMAFNLAADNSEVVDLHGGIKDLEQKNIRAVGNPIERFTEDGLRPYRACRFASTLGFEMDENTFAAIRETLNVARMVSMERVQNEFMRLLLESPKPSIGIELLRQSGLLEIFLPELIEGFGIEQNDFHVDDVYWHNLHCVDIAHDDVKLAALLHDIAKPQTKQGPHFYGHDLKGADMAKVIMKRLKFSNDEIERVSNLVRWHMFYYPFSEAETDEKKQEIREQMMKSGWTDSAVRRFIRNVGGQDAINDLFKLRIADATCNAKSAWNPKEIDALQERISAVLQQDMVMKVTDLDITGEDLMKLGVPKGPKIGEVLNYLLEQVEENPNLNGKDELKTLVMEYLRK